MNPGASRSQIRPPSRLLLLAEGRVVPETAATLALWPLLQLTPHGDGHSVLVLPGLLAGDGSTELLREYLHSRGYDAHGWLQGRNLGPRPGVERGMSILLDKLAQRSGRKVSIVGWSLGGVYARILAHRQPDRVRSVITLGSPFAASGQATNAWRIYEAVSHQPASGERRVNDFRPTPPVPTTSIYSRSDGVVSWRCSLEQPGPHSENIEVFSSHIGLGTNPSVLYALADRLAQPEGHWRPFHRHRLHPPLYPRPAGARAVH